MGVNPIPLNILSHRARSKPLVPHTRPSPLSHSPPLSSRPAYPTPPSIPCTGDPCGRPLYTVQPTPRRGGSGTARSPSLTTCDSERSEAESRNLVAVERLPRHPSQPPRCPRGCGDPSSPLPVNPFPLDGGKVGACPELVEGMGVNPIPLNILSHRARSKPLVPHTRPPRCPRGCGDPSPSLIRHTNP